MRFKHWENERSHLFTETWGNFYYQVPDDKERQLYDFYMYFNLKYMSHPRSQEFLHKTGYDIKQFSTIRPDNDPDREDIIDHMIDEVGKTLLPRLRKNILQAIFYSICAEMKHCVEKYTSNYGGLVKIANELGAEHRTGDYGNGMNKYLQYLTLYNNSEFQKIARRPKNPNKEVEEEQDYYQAAKKNLGPELFDLMMRTIKKDQKKHHPKITEKIMLDTLKKLYVSLQHKSKRLMDKLAKQQDNKLPHYFSVLVHELDKMLQKLGTGSEEDIKNVIKPQKYDTSNASYNAALRSGLSQKNFIQLSQTIFNKANWPTLFGGAVWGRIAQAWLWLHDAKDNDEITMYIDHAYDLMHHTATVFNKLNSFLKGNNYSWLLKALNKKADIKNLHEIIDKISPSLKKLASQAIFIKTGKTYEELIKKSSPNQQTQQSNIQTTEEVKCMFCDKTEDNGQAISDGWIPSFWHTISGVEKEYSMLGYAICPTCGHANLIETEDKLSYILPENKPLPKIFQQAPSDKSNQQLPDVTITASTSERNKFKKAVELYHKTIVGSPAKQVARILLDDNLFVSMLPHHGIYKGTLPTKVKLSVYHQVIGNTGPVINLGTNQIHIILVHHTKELETIQKLENINNATFADDDPDIHTLIEELKWGSDPGDYKKVATGNITSAIQIIKKRFNYPEKAASVLATIIVNQQKTQEPTKETPAHSSFASTSLAKMSLETKTWFKNGAKMHMARLQGDQELKVARVLLADHMFCDALNIPEQKLKPEQKLFIFDQLVRNTTDHYAVLNLYNREQAIINQLLQGQSDNNVQQLIDDLLQNQDIKNNILQKKPIGPRVLIRNRTNYPFKAIDHLIKLMYAKLGQG